MSEHDRAVLQKARPSSQLGLVPLGINLLRYPFEPSPCGSRRILFVGPAEYYRNATGLTWFLDQVYLRVLELWPDAVLRVVNVVRGSPIDRYIARFPHTETIPFVADIREEFRDAAVSIAPMVVASGVSGRVITSLALGVPVVATSLACQGLAARQGEHLWVADEPGAFAHAVVTVGNMSAADRSALLSNARRYVESHHDVRQAAAMLEGQLERLIAERDDVG